MKLAGKLNFANCVVRHRIGRAYIRPIYIQAHDPVQGLSFWGELALQWWDEWLQKPATLWISPTRARPTVHAYTDASGADRWLAAYFRDENLEWWWTRTQVPENIWRLFFDREDNKIGVQELLAIALLLETFPDKIEGRAMFAWCDNFGVVGAIKNGGSRTVDVNAVIGRMWLHLARLDAPVVFYYVHTKSNVADGATRNDCSFAEKYGAVWREPTFPDYVHEIWNAEEPERALRSLASDPRFTVPAPSEI